MPIKHLTASAFALAKRLTVKAGDKLARGLAQPSVLRMMQDVYDDLQKIPFPSVEALIAHNEEGNAKLREMGSPDLAIDTKAWIERGVYGLAHAKSSAASAVSTVVSIHLKQISEHPFVDNTRMYYVLDEKGNKVGLSDLKALAKQKEVESHLAYVRDMLIHMDKLTRVQMRAIHNPRPSETFEFGETNYQYGIRMMVNTIVPYLMNHNEGFARDAFIQRLGVKGLVSNIVIDTVFNDIEADINNRQATRGQVLRAPRDRTFKAGYQ